MSRNETPGPRRGEIWSVCFDPSVGAEVCKARPAIVISEDEIGTLPLRIVVPVTGWSEKFTKAQWHVKLKGSKLNGLSKDSSADCFQVKSISLTRFRQKIGIISEPEQDEISAAIALCVGYSP